MTNRDGLITALQCWAGEVENPSMTKEGCKKFGCLYADGSCEEPVMKDALEYIRQLESERNAMEEYIKKNKSVEAYDSVMNTVNHPSHYNTGSIEVIDAIESWGLNFSRGNAVKYIARAGHKGADKEIEDLEKSKWYVQREIDRLKGTDSHEQF